MAIEYHINERDELITLTASGTVTSAEACGCINEMLADASFDANLPQLIDLRAAEPGGTTDDLIEFEDFLLGEYQPRLGSTVAIVVNQDWDEPTCARAFWMSCALGLAELFDNWNQACKWLVTREFSADMADTPGLESLKDVFQDAFLEEDDFDEDCSADRSSDERISNKTADTDADAETETASTTDSATQQD